MPPERRHAAAADVCCHFVFAVDASMPPRSAAATRRDSRGADCDVARAARVICHFAFARLIRFDFAASLIIFLRHAAIFIFAFAFAIFCRHAYTAGYASRHFHFRCFFAMPFAAAVSAFQRCHHFSIVFFIFIFSFSDCSLYSPYLSRQIFRLRY